MNKTDKSKAPSSFSEVINADTPVLVDFYTDWCGPCKMMTPILKDLKKEMGSKINIIKVDAEKNADAAIKYQVRGVPTLILFKNGRILWQQSGVVQLPQLKSIINQKLSEL
ncbi:thioredoxin [Balneolaceae bacterium YR4-1]|uniref:Thioredoxin n=1 Tax=Halalkalibaculum roseum TaxID=2709311 RepID=A0A6M1SQ80_9BACT|nr:thioredoxin [Halalkalibaculum roseum]NGP77521.1 thioredoxin [Halalkalibaculum roseum]